MSKLYAVFDKATGTPVPSYPDLHCQGGVASIDGNQPVIELFRSKKIANDYRRYLLEGWYTDEPLPTYVVREVTLIAK